MPIWKITQNGPSKLLETRFKQEKMLEEKLEEWIEADPTLMGEPLLIIGRQVLIPDTRDMLDLLAIDPQGNAVIIELKRGQIKEPVDMQALRYASYISRWRFEDFENQARNYLKKVNDAEFNFNELYESFCESTGVDEPQDLNQDQRIIIVGTAVREKLGSVALWLREHNIDITVIELQAYKVNDDVFVQPNVVIPLKVSKFSSTGRIQPENSPWISDGRTWHLEKKCSPTTKEMFLKLDKNIRDNFEGIESPSWNQKYYVAYRIGRYNWLIVKTAPKMLCLDFLVEANVFKSEDIAKKLGIAKFEKEESIAEKLKMSSSVIVFNINENNDRIRIRIKEDFNLESKEFLEFLEVAYDAFPKSLTG